MLAPWSWLWLGLLLPLVALYVLKRRRVERRVGSVLLWEAALRDLRAERPWRRLRPYLSLLLQALVVVLGAAALARPIGGRELPRGAQTVVLVDSSASMAGVEASGRAPLDEARDLVSALATSLPPGGTLMVIAAAAVPEVLTPPTADGEQLARAARRIGVRGAKADLQAALALASDRLRGAPQGSRIVLLSDLAGAGSLDTAGLSAPVEVRALGSGGASVRDNTGIVAFELRAGSDPTRRDRVEGFVRLAHAGARPVELYVTMATVPTSPSAAPRTLASRRVRLSPGQSESLVLPAELPPSEDGVAPFVEAALTSLDGAPPYRDALALDDRAWAPSPGRARLPVFLIGGGQRALEQALVADEQVELYRTTLAKLRQQAEGAGQASAAGPGHEGASAHLDGWRIYAGETPDAPPPGESLVVAPQGAAVFGVPLGAPTSGDIVSWDELDESLRFVRLRDVHLRSVRPIVGDAARALARGSAGVVLGRAERPGGATTIVAFDPDDSDWPSRPSFVLFVRNLLERVRQARARGGVPSGSIGEALAIPTTSGEKLVVTTPTGGTLHADAQGSLTVLPVEPVPGIYRIEGTPASGAAQPPRHLAALRNLLDADETNLAPRLKVTERGEVRASASPQEIASVELWPWFAIALLLVLLVETLWATRRGAT